MDKEETRDPAYDIPFADCKKSYLGETQRKFITRKGEHQKAAARRQGETKIKQRSLCKTFFGVSSIKNLRSNTEFENAGKTMLITTSCALIGHIRNNVNDLKDYNEKECCSNVSSCF